MSAQRRMTLYPAIDILDGHAVRLTKGDFEAKKVYDEDPLEAAARWVGEGAEYLHVVDLDGARLGRPVNLDHVKRIAQQLSTPVQLGGGLRTLEAIGQALDAGVERVILGTAAFTSPGLLERALQQYGGERVMVSVDVRAGTVSIEGWTQNAAIDVKEVFAKLGERGVREMLYTNVDRDGMLEGQSDSNVRWVAKGAHPANLIYSGGIGQLADLQALAALREPNLRGVIVGKALYERRFTVAEALAALAG